MQSSDLEVHQLTSYNEVRKSAYDEVMKLGGYMSLADGVKFIERIEPSLKRDTAREIIRSIVGNKKRGPRGPRKNSAK